MIWVQISRDNEAMCLEDQRFLSEKVEGAEEQQVLGCVLSAFVKISTTIHIHGVPVCVQRSQGKVQVTHVYCV